MRKSRRAPATPPIVRVSARAMATLFELMLWGREERYLRTVTEEAIAEIHRLEQQLSLYRDDSDVYDLNYNAWRRPIPVDPRLFALLQRAKALSEATGGAFDITVAPLVKAWGFMGASGAPPDPGEVAVARELVGMDLVELDPENHSVHFLREGVMLDLGAIGKGYAIEQVAEMLRDYEIPGALIHGGTSTVQAVGAQPDGSSWPVAIRDPRASDQFLAIVGLQDNAISVSAVHGKYFEEGEARYGHVLDPRKGEPVQGALLAAVVSISATATDALSTALLVSGEPFLETLCERPDTGGLVAFPDGGQGFRVVSRSLPVLKTETALQ